MCYRQKINTEIILRDKASTIWRFIVSRKPFMSAQSNILAESGIRNWMIFKHGQSGWPVEHATLP
jgi:hypothetical protein